LSLPEALKAVLKTAASAFPLFLIGSTLGLAASVVVGPPLSFLLVGLGYFGKGPADGFTALATTLLIAPFVSPLCGLILAIRMYKRDDPTDLR
jgi:hypothetical protein